MPRKEEFLPNGKRVTVTPRQLADAWRRHDPRGEVDLHYVVGTAQHEAGMSLNERDTEESGYISEGIFQLSAEEAAHAGCTGANLLDLDESCVVFQRTCVQRLAALRQAAGMVDGASSPSLYGFLAIAHNQGLAAALKSIRAHGMDWTAYKKRNTSDQSVANHAYMVKMAAYGDDVISGGRLWSDDLLEPSPS